MNNAIIIFVRNPELGKVKTRLAREIGDASALEVYKKLLQHTHDITCNLNCHKYVYYAGAVTEKDLWDNETYFKAIQEGNDLGERMMNAFQALFEAGYKKLVIIGSDCPELSSSLIDKAFQLLESSEVVFGPAADGGYYLLGLTQLCEKLFENKSWSTGSVMADSIHDLSGLKISYALLPVLRDIDTNADLKNFKQLLFL